MTAISDATRRGLCLLVLLVGGLALVPLPAVRAQDEARFRIEIVSQPTWRGAGDDFNLRVRITNLTDEAVEGYRLVVGVFFRVQTRSDLHDRFDLSTLEAPSSFPLEFPDTILPGDSLIKKIEGPLSDSPVLSTAIDNGVYPLKVSLIDDLGVVLDQASTQLLYYPALPDPPDLAMNAALVLPINDLPARSPGGVFVPDPEGSYPLEEALAEGGWLLGMIDAIEAEVARTRPRQPARGKKPPVISPHLRLGISPSARMIEELADMADGYMKEIDGEVERVASDSEPARAAKSAIARLGKLLTSSAVQMIPAPYSFSDLPSIARIPAAIPKQLAEASAVYRDVLAARFSNEWVFAPGGRVDQATLDQLRLAGIGGNTFFDESSLVTSPDLVGCPTAILSPTCPIEISAGTETVVGYAIDPDIQTRVIDATRPGAGRSDLQRLFAEIAQIREEEPSRGNRIVHLTVPATWHPSPRLFNTFLKGLSRAPWLELMTPEEGLGAADDLSQRGVVGTLEAHPRQPDDAYFAALVGAGETVESFSTIEPPTALVTRLRRNVLMGFGRVWWGDRTSDGARYGTQSVGEVSSELGKIGLIGSDTTLSSRKGRIQIVVFNDTGYPVKVGVELISSNLTVNDGDLTLDIPTEQQTVAIDVTAQTSGTFPIDVRLQTPDGGLTIEEPTTIRIRSTEFNRVALGVTFGALAFLILFYLVRGIRKRRPTDKASGETSTA